MGCSYVPGRVWPLQGNAQILVTDP